ncbi:uncharacterized protein LOC124940732 [Impatiens glandulifera]|uniref:uncharacterized protein LOC124940732 n=1 Tax=Impatiens glandulifera TaxID=253017 RepID=UPI001FB13F66|nr:uncharacterized protein LOC124940732 [Impatiens glandulifera]
MMASSSPLFLSLKSFIWDSLSTYFLFLFTLFRTRVFRSKKSNGMKHDEPDCPETELQPDKEEEGDRGGVLMVEDKEEPGLSFGFRFQSYEEFSRSRTEDENPRTEKSFCTFLEESEKQNRDEYEDSAIKSESIQEKVVEEEEEDEFKGITTVQDEGKSCSIMDSLDEIDSASESSTGSVPLRLLMNRLLDSYSDGFLSDKDETIDETQLQKPAYIDTVSSESDRDPNEEYPFSCSSSEEEELEEEEEENVYTTEELSRIEKAHYRDMESLEQSDNKETSEDLDGPWEHEELMEQLKIELENVKTRGLLPTIEEDSEYSKITEDLKPWRMEEKLEKANHMDSLHKFYKTYRERMRKFDMLNYQKTYAMGLIQLKNGGREVSFEKRSQSWLCKRKKVQNESVLKLMKDLQDDMEVVYVGQLCLSWDFLHLQYKTALKLWESDDRRLRRYSEVALQFQRFQVLINRFVEEEPFRGPRVQYYVKTRCILRNLLQIPLIREDKRRKGELSSVMVSSDMLVEIIEECIRIFWRFLRADKDSCCWGRMRLTCIDVPNCRVDSGLLMEIRNDVWKLKNKLRRENCILRKLRMVGRRGDYDDEDEEEDEGSVYFFSKVEVRLVVRVLKMSGLTMEQLAWCRTKLNNISFSHRTVHLGPSFLLFPA